jgi:flagellar motor switch protein FliG
MLREDIANLGPVKLRDVDEAQAAMVLVAKDMAQRGEIEIGGEADEEMVI